MAHPYRSAGRTGAKSKFMAMLGSSKGAKHTNDDSVINGSNPVKNGVEDVKIMGKPPSRRLDRARGGKVSKKGVTVNVIVPPSPGAAPPPPMMPPPGLMPPPGPGAMPPMGAKPPMPIPPPGGPPPPMMRADGGEVKPLTGSKKGSFTKRINKMDPLSGIMPQSGIGKDYVPGMPPPDKKFGGGLPKAGADSGVGRLQRSKMQKKGK